MFWCPAVLLSCYQGFVSTYTVDWAVLNSKYKYDLPCASVWFSLPSVYPASLLVFRTL
jgi:hypothetical protein